MKDAIESQGKTVDEAISEALLQLGARADEVEVTVLEEPRAGFLGIVGSRPARVRVARRTPAQRGRTGGGRRETASGSDGGGETATIAAAGGDRGARASGGDRRSNHAGERDPSKPRRRRRGGRSRRKREGVAAPNENAGRDAAPADKGRAPARHEASSTRETERRVDRAAAGSTDRSEARPSPAGAASDDGGTSGATAVAEGLSAIDRAAPIRDRDPDSAPDTLLELTTELMRRGGFPSRCEVLPDEYQLVRIVTDDESAGRLIGRHGSGVDAVEHLVDRMATQAFGQRVKLNLDINNYRRKRESQLVERAQAAVAAVRETGREQRLEPLCARERRVVHLEVMKSDGLTSYTVQGPEGKQVVVALDGGQPRADAVVGEADGDAT